MQFIFLVRKREKQTHCVYTYRTTSLTANLSLTYAIKKFMNNASISEKWKEISKTQKVVLRYTENYHILIMFISDKFAYKLMCL